MESWAIGNLHISVKPTGERFAATGLYRKFHEIMFTLLLWMGKDWYLNDSFINEVLQLKHPH